jgi:hypothetical protein
MVRNHAAAHSVVCVAFAALLAVVAAPVVLSAADISGVWTMVLDPDFNGKPGQMRCAFAQEGQKLKAECGRDIPIYGEVNGQTMTLQMPQGDREDLAITMTGTIDAAGTSITGTWYLIAETGKDQTGKFEARKE